MPYIPQEDRRPLNPLIEALSEELTMCEADGSGDGRVNYAITEILVAYFVHYQKPGYLVFERMIGLVELVKLETWRRLVAAYEDRKWKKNRDVYL